MLAIPHPVHLTDLAVAIATNLQYRMDGPVDRGPGISHRHGHRIHQERHVIGHGAQAGHIPGAGRRADFYQQVLLALAGQLPVTAGELEKVFRSAGIEGGLAGHFKIGSKKAAKQWLLIRIDLRGQHPFQLGQHQRLALGGVLHPYLRHPNPTCRRPYRQVFMPLYTGAMRQY